MSTIANTRAAGGVDLRPARAAALTAFAALMWRDLRVLRRASACSPSARSCNRSCWCSCLPTSSPRSARGSAGRRTRKRPSSTLLMAGVVATSMIFQGVQAVALPLVQEFGYTREIEDRVMAPLPVWGIARAEDRRRRRTGPHRRPRRASLAAFIPATPVHLHVHWLYLLTIAPIGAVLSASFGLVMGTRVKPTQVPLLFAIVVLPITFLGAVYYPWEALAPVRSAAGHGAHQSAVYMARGSASHSPAACRTCPSGRSTLPCWALPPFSSGSASTGSDGACSPRAYRDRLLLGAGARESRREGTRLYRPPEERHQRQAGAQTAHPGPSVEAVDKGGRGRA